MAQKARKDLAKSNLAALNNLHIGSLVVNLFFLLTYFTFKSRSIVLWVLFSLPGFLCQFALERTGRPTIDFNTGVIKSAGEDLAAPGLTEYMWDVIWVTWAVEVLVLFFGNWGWVLWAVVPAYGVYKGYGLLGAAKQIAGMGAGMGGMDNDAGAAPAGNRKQRRTAA